MTENRVDNILAIEVCLVMSLGALLLISLMDLFVLTVAYFLAIMSIVVKMTYDIWWDI